jgi:hypothetical protein
MTCARESGKIGYARLLAAMALCLGCLLNVACAGFSSSSTSQQNSTQFSISGNITPASNAAGVTVTLGGAANATTTADSAGNYNFSGLSNGGYSVTPSKTGLSFSPPSQAITLAAANSTGVNFTASQTVTDISISGTITPTADGSGATVTLSGAASAVTAADTTGAYSFRGLASGAYTITPSKAGFSFGPASQDVTAGSADITGVNFTAGSVLQSSGPVVITGQNGTVIQGLRITSTSGNCVTITNSTNITIENSEIGPCAGNGVVISGGSGTNIYDSYIHPETQATTCCDHNDGIFASDTQNLVIQGDVIAYGEDNIQVDGSSGITVSGNFLLNPRNNAPNGARGHQFQSWANSTSVVVINNYALSSSDTSEYLYASAVQDAISFGKTTNFSAQNNFINGGQPPYGCAIIADTTTNNGSFTYNSVLDSGNCGIEIASGNHNTIDHNRVLNRNPNSNGETPVALSVWASYFSRTGETCSYGTVTNNIAAIKQLDGSYANGLFAPSSGSTSCFPLTESGNTLDAAAVPILTTPSVNSVFPTPAIPPQPKSCVVTSLYSTQTAMPPCAN